MRPSAAVYITKVWKFAQNSYQRFPAKKQYVESEVEAFSKGYEEIGAKTAEIRYSFKLVNS
jgi:hypothetical protein